MRTGTLRGLHYIVILVGIIFLVWGLLQTQSYVLTKEAGVEGTGMIVTEEVPPGSILWVHTTASKKMDTRVVRMTSREMAFSENNTYFDRHLSAGGPGEGNGIGTDVTLTAPTISSTRFTILIKAPADATDYSEADVSYKVECTIWTPGWEVIVTGIILIFSAMVMGTVLGIGLFGPSHYKPKGREAPLEVRGEEAPEEPRAPAPARAPAYGAPPPRRAPAPAPAPEPVPYAPAPAYAPEPEITEEPAPAPPPVRRGEPSWDISPARVERPPPAPAPVAEAPRQPLKKIKCSACGAIIPVYSAERPLRVTCPLCGRQGTLRT